MLDLKEIQDSFKGDFKLFDVHIHGWSNRFFEEFLEYGKQFGIEQALIMGSSKLLKLKKQNFDTNIIYCYFLSSQAFAKFQIDKLKHQIEEARKLDYKILKIFFGPRFITFTKRTTPYKINDEKLDPIYSLMEDYNFKVLIHVADPDIWYANKYTNTSKYGTKQDRIADFKDLLERYKKIKFISAHFGSLPEDLDTLGNLFDSYPNLNIDTSSARWVIRELGKDAPRTKLFFEKYQDRILFGSDLANMQFKVSFFFRKKEREYFWASRYGSLRLFFETSKSLPLLFRDKDAPIGENTLIHGLNLPESMLKKIYCSNAENFFKNS